MKRFILAVMLLLVAGVAMGDTLNVSSRTVWPNTWQQMNEAYTHAAEHGYVRWDGTCTLTPSDSGNTGDTDTTYWIQTNSLPSKPDSSATGRPYFICRDLTLVIWESSAGDSAGLDSAKVQFSDSNGCVLPIVCADSCTAFLKAGNSNFSDFRTWLFEAWGKIPITSPIMSRKHAYPIKIYAPFGYCRFMFSLNGVADTVTLKWFLIGTW